MFDDGNDLQMRNITMLAMNLDWFYVDKMNFVSFASQLQDRPNNVYSSEFVSSMLE